MNPHFVTDTVLSGTVLPPRRENRNGHLVNQCTPCDQRRRPQEGSEGNDRLYSGSSDQSGSFLLMGLTSSNDETSGGGGVGDEIIVSFKLDTEGRVVWRRQVWGGGIARARGLGRIVGCHSFCHILLSCVMTRRSYL